jgi:hypothetical protein
VQFKASECENSEQMGTEATSHAKTELEFVLVLHIAHPSDEYRSIVNASMHAPIDWAELTDDKD